MFYIPKNFEDFSRLAEQGNIIPLMKVLPADLLTPVAAFLRLHSYSKYSFLYESVEGNEQVARYSFLGVDPHLVLRVRDGKLEIVNGEEILPQTGDLLEALRLYLSQLIPVRVADLPPFIGGIVGYFGQDSLRWIEPHLFAQNRTSQFNDALVMFFSSILIFDHFKQQLTIVANLFTDSSTQELEARYHQAIAQINEIEKILAGPVNLPAKQKRIFAPQVRASFTKEQFETAVERVKNYIKASEIIQITLSECFELDVVCHPLQIYRALRMLKPAPFMYYLKMNETVLIGSSGDMLVRCSGRQLDYRPVVGNRPRSGSDIDDALLGEELRADERYVAEHVTLVDLGRSDLGRVSEYGSVEVLDLMLVERNSQTINMISNLRGQLQADKDAFDALLSCFPAGSATGIPKLRALKILEELESVPRGPYAGTVFYYDYFGNLNSCTANRTIIVQNNKAYVQTGVRIVADSIADKEYFDLVSRSRSLLKAIEMAEKDL